LGTAVLIPWAGPGINPGCPDANLYGWEVYVSSDLSGNVAIARSMDYTKCPPADSAYTGYGYPDVFVSWA